MDGPEILIKHYASLAFLTRIAALTFVGAIVGTTFERAAANNDVRVLVGWGVLLVIAALGELNRRYTHAFVAAVYAASRQAHPPDAHAAVTMRWEAFRRANGMMWSTVRSRFVLSWLSCVPGFLLGEYLLVTAEASPLRYPGVSFGLVLLTWWVLASFRRYPIYDKSEDH